MSKGKVLVIGSHAGSDPTNSAITCRNWGLSSAVANALTASLSEP